MSERMSDERLAFLTGALDDAGSPHLYHELCMGIRAERTAVESESKAAGHWMAEANKEHNENVRLVKACAALEAKPPTDDAVREALDAVEFYMAVCYDRPHRRKTGNRNADLEVSRTAVLLHAPDLANTITARLAATERPTIGAPDPYSVGYHKGWTDGNNAAKSVAELEAATEPREAVGAGAMDEVRVPLAIAKAHMEFRYAKEFAILAAALADVSRLREENERLVAQHTFDSQQIAELETLIRQGGTSCK